MSTQSSIYNFLIICALLAFGTARCCHQHAQNIVEKPGKSAICILLPDGNSGVKGIVTLHQQSPLHPLYFEFLVVGLGKQSYHGAHIHEFGDLTEGCKTAGPHFNPHSKTHGGRHDTIRHVGDLGNIFSDLRGVSQTCFEDRMATLFGQNSILGRSIVVHKNRDDEGRGGDQQSKKTGNAGARLACGVIGLSGIFKHYQWDGTLNDFKLSD